MALLENPSPHYPYNHCLLPSVGVMFEPHRDTPLTVPPPVTPRPDCTVTGHTPDNFTYPTEAPFPMNLPPLKKAPMHFIAEPLPKADCYDRTSVNNTQSHTLSEFVMEGPTLSGVDLQFALLEKALGKDLAPTPAPAIAPPRLTANTVLDSNFSLSDILGDDAVPPPSIPNMIKGEDLDDGHCHSTYPMDRTVPMATPTFPVGPPLHHPPPQSLMLSQDSGHAETDQSSAFGSESLGRGCDDEIFTSDDLSLSASERTRGTGTMQAPGSIESPASGISMCEKIDDHTYDDGMCSHPDEFKNLKPDVQALIRKLQGIISAMPRRKLRESLARKVKLEDVEPLMALNRDELAIMLGLGVTTWKTFMHSLGVMRWPARALKSQQVKEQKTLEKKIEAERRGDLEMGRKYAEEHRDLLVTHARKRKMLLNDAKLRVSRDSGIRKKGRKYFGM